MNRIVLAASSTLLAALMVLVQPVSATTEVTVTVTDREGDTGGGVTCLQDEYGEWIWDPLTIFPESSEPASILDCLDIIEGWLTYECTPNRVKSVTMGMTLAAPLDPEVTDLPGMAKKVRWVWFFYQEIPVFHGDYYIYIDWDGEEFAVYLADYASSEKEWNSYVPLIPMDLEADVKMETFIDDCGIERMNIVVTPSEREILGLLLTCNYWFFETMLTMKVNYEELDAGGWCAADVTDKAEDASVKTVPFWSVPAA